PRVATSLRLSPLTPPIPLLSFFHAPPPTRLYTLSLHDALPISREALTEDVLHEAYGLRAEVWEDPRGTAPIIVPRGVVDSPAQRSEEHTSELQSRFDLVCRLLLEKKKKRQYRPHDSHINAGAHH